MMRKAGFYFYLLFVVSWFLHLPSRLPILGIIKMDLLLVAIMVGIMFVESTNRADKSGTDKALKMLIGFAIIAIPFAEWPGTAVKVGLELFIKAVVFYFFTIAFVTTEKRLKIFVLVYIGCQTFRVLEPMYLYLTQGILGGHAYGGGEMIYRLTGAKHDIIGPNGLAFIIVSIIPFYHYLAKQSLMNKILYIVALPLLLYALILTSSRSGLIGFFLILLGIFIKSRHKSILAVVILAGILISVPMLSSQQIDRYRSIFDPKSKHAESAEFRTEFNREAFRTTLNRPLFGHGLATSYELNCNVLGICGPAHNLYIEVAQELGYIGLFLFLQYIWSVFKGFKDALKNIQEKIKDDTFLIGFAKAMQVWLFMSLIFSFASYGLLIPIWYLFGGLSVVLMNISSNLSSSPLELENSND